MLRLCLDACIWYQPKYATCAHDAVEKKRVDGVMEITLAATTTPSDVAMPASLSSDLRGSSEWREDFTRRACLARSKLK